MLHTRLRNSCCMVVTMLWTLFLQGQVTADFTADVTTGCGSLQVSFSDMSSSGAGAITSWSWNLGGVNSTNQNPGRIFGTPGTYEICLTVTDAQNDADTKCVSDYIEVFPLPQPDFTLDVNEGCAPLVVTFTDMTTPAQAPIQEWIWGLGGSSSVLVENANTTVSSTYTNPDDYTVSLTVQDENDCSNTVTQTDLITVHPDPDIQVSVDEPFGCQLPFTANFTNDLIDPDLTYSWDFGNGTTFSGAIPNPVVYENPGTYGVTVTATNQNTNCQVVQTFENILQIGYPVDIVYENDDNCQGASFTFMDNSTTPTDSVRWDFGDGQSSTEPNPTHVFNTAGCFEVSLIRYTPDCPSERILDCITITPGLVGFAFNDNAEACTVPHTVNFAAVSNEAIAYSWDFQDGGTSTQQNPQHTFDDFGIYPVELTIEDANGCVAVITDSIKVIETTAQLSVQEYWGCAPYDFIMDETSLSSSDIVEWEWEIFDLNNQSVFVSDLENPEVTLIDTGLYNLQLVVANVEGCRDTALFEGIIAVGNEVFANFEGTPRETCIDGAVSFEDLSTGHPNFWIYNFGDGGESLGIPSPSHEYVDTGYFDVHLAVFHYGCYADTLLEDYIHVNPPIGLARTERNCANTYEISFEDRSFGADSVFWDFGEPNLTNDTSTLFNPVHVYSDTGCFQVLHTVFNFTTGCEDTDTISLCITDPSALFSIGNTDGCVPLTIEILDNSVHADQFEWLAEGATIDDPNSPNPQITFETPGLYNGISLIVNDVQECSDTLTLNENIFARGLLMEADISPEGGCRPLEVTFEDESVSAFSTPVAWEWNVGDGLALSDQSSFSQVFDTVGWFDVQLTVTDGDGCSQTLTTTEAFEVTEPIANFTADTLSCTADLVGFSNQSTGGTLTYLWDFGDGTTSADKNPQHQYTSEGTFTVCLSIENQYGCTDSICKTDFISIIDPQAGFTVDSAYAFCPPLLSQFQNTSQNANYYEWDFGDDSGTSDLENPSHIYTIPGTYDVQLIAGSTENCRDTVVMGDFINLDGPVGEFSFVVDTSCAPMTVSFTGISDDFYDYIWDYGNGELDTVELVTTSMVSYEYESIDTYVPKLILVDQSNCVRAFESPESIAVTGVNVDFTATLPVLCEDIATTSFINLTQSTTPVNSVQWILEGTDLGASTASEPTATYLDAGSYDVTLMVETDFCQDTLTKTNFITVGTLPAVDFTPSATQICQYESISFVDNSTIAVGGLSNWIWDFGDGGFANIPNPTHTFMDAGTFEVTLSVTSDLECTAIQTTTVEVLPVPIVTLTDTLTICRGETAILTATLMDDSTQVDYAWTAAPEMSCTDCLTTSVRPTVSTAYSFTATGTNGCSIVHNSFVVVLPFDIPVITMTPDTAICGSDIIQLSATGGSDIYAYEWDQSRPGLSCYSACFNPVASPDISTTYVLTVTNGEGCSATDSVRVDIVDQFIPLSGEDETICQGDSVQLTTGVEGLIWTNPENLTCTYCPDPFAFPDSTILYQMQMTTEEGCVLRDSVTVTVLTMEDIDAGKDTVICKGSEIVLGGNGFGVFSWFPEASLDNPSILSPIARPDETTRYVLRAEEGLCILRDSVLVEVVETTTLEGMETRICVGDTVDLAVTGNANKVEWIPADHLSNNMIDNPMAYPDQTTAYTVVGTLEHCPADTALVIVEVDQGAGITLSAESIALPNEPLVLTPNIVRPGNYAYSWFPEAGLSCADCLNPQVDSASIGQTYALFVTDLDTGCEIELTTTTDRLKGCGDDLIWVPNAFSPNNDGVNDELFVYSPVIRDITSFRIFNRWGAVVFQTDNMADGWNGGFKSQTAPTGVYVYVVEAICPVTGHTFLIRGDVTLVY